MAVRPAKCAGYRCPNTGELAEYSAIWRSPRDLPLNIALLLLFLAVAITIIYSIYLALSTLAFWFTRIEEVATIIWLHSSAGSFPLSAYPPWARVMFTFVIPVAFVTNVPAEAATGRLTWEWGLGGLAFGAAALTGATRLWSRAIRNYSSASS